MTRHPRAAVTAALEASGVIAVIRLADAGQIRAVVDALADGGVRAIEVTMTVPGAVEIIEALVTSLPREFFVGAGTVTDEATARRVVEAGAAFVVGPVLRPAVIDICHDRDVAVMPGCFTPTEILTAWELGADIVKVFPATALGPGFFRDLRGPMPQVRLMPTGGVTAANAGEWIAAGAVAIGVGTALVDPALVAERRFDALTARARHFIHAVGAARGVTAGA